MIDTFSALIPQSLLTTSGKVFYSGRTAFGAPSRLYILGLNPGGSPREHVSETVGSHTKQVLSEFADWSAYRDEGWRGKPPGMDKMQLRLLHLMRRLNLEPQCVPASNLVFVRSTRAAGIEDRFHNLADLCWPFHEGVMCQLGARVVLCLGKDCGEWVCKKVEATNQIDEFTESNDRRWKSTAFTNSDGIAVIVATHPSIADWTKPATDPSHLVLRVLAGMR